MEGGGFISSKSTYTLTNGASAKTSASDTVVVCHYSTYGLLWRKFTAAGKVSDATHRSKD